MCGKIVSRNDGKWLHHNTPDCIDCITHLGSPPRPHCYQPFPAWPVTGLTNSLMMGISCNCYCLYTDTEYLERDNRWSRSSITIWHCRWSLSSWDIDIATHNKITPSCVIVDCWCEIRGIISKWTSFSLFSWYLIALISILFIEWSMIIFTSPYQCPQLPSAPGPAWWHCACEVRTLDCN